MIPIGGAGWSDTIMAVIPMAKRPVEFLNGKELAGELTEPIDHDLYMPFLGAVGSPDGAKYLAQRKKELRRRRTAKMPALAHHLGIDVDRFNLSPENGLGWMMLYAVIAERLAEELIPGFQERSRGMLPREVLGQARIAIALLRLKGKAKSQLEACEEIIKLWYPELGKPGRRSELKRKADSLRVRVAEDRVKTRKSAAG
jgi:hypothetical protein